MVSNQIPLIMQRLDKIVTEDRIMKYPTALIVKIIVILKIYGVSYGSSKYFFNNLENYKDPESSWGYSTMGYEYGRKVHAVMDTDSLSVMEWKTPTASVYDKNIAFEMIDSIRNYNYILMDAAYDSSDIYMIISLRMHMLSL